MTVFQVTVNTSNSRTDCRYTTIEVSEWSREVYSSEAHVFSKYITISILHRKLQATLSLCMPWKHRGEMEVECVWNLMAHGDAREGKWRGNWRMEWVASTLTLPRNVVYPALLTLIGTPQLPAVDWTDAPADLNGLVRFGERRNPVSARVPSHFKRSLQMIPRSASLQPTHPTNWAIVVPHHNGLCLHWPYQLKATHTFKISNIIAFPRPQWSRERASVLL